MSHAGAAPAAAPLPGTRWPGCAWSTEPRPPPPGDTQKVTAPRGRDPAPCGAGGTAAPQNPPTHPSTLTPGLKGWSRVTSSSTGCPKGFSAEPGSYMEKAWRSRRCGGAVPGGCPCSGRSLGAGVGCAGPVCCRICVFSACSLWICSREKGEGISEEGVTLTRGVPLAPHPPRAAAGAAHRSGCCSPSSVAAPWPQRQPEPSSPPGTPAA